MANLFCTDIGMHKKYDLKVTAAVLPLCCICRCVAWCMLAHCMCLCVVCILLHGRYVCTCVSAEHCVCPTVTQLQVVEQRLGKTVW